MVPTFEIPAYPQADDGTLYVDQFPIRNFAGKPVTRTVSLGRKAPRPGRATVQLADFLALVGATPPPASVDYSSLALASIRNVLGNDRQGNCVIASGGHGLGVWSGNDTDSGGIIVQSVNEALSEYHRIGGPGDNGLVMVDALNDFVRTGLLAGGARRKISGWAAVAQSKTMMQFAIAAFGSARIGFNVPQEWMNAAREGFVWDTPRAYAFVGGHDVRLVGYDSVGVKVSTWGLLGTMTWAALLNPRIVDELYVEVSPNWTNADNLAPSKFNVTALTAALAQVAAGVVPSWVDDPTPPVPPPVPPTPPTPPVGPIVSTGQTAPKTITFTVPGPLGGSRPVSITIPPLDVRVTSGASGLSLDFGPGLFVPVSWDDSSKAPQEAPAAGPLPWVQIIALVSKIVPVVVADVQAGKKLPEILADVFAALYGKGAAASLSPEQWAKIWRVIVAVVPVIIGAL